MIKYKLFLMEERLVWKTKKGPHATSMKALIILIQLCYSIMIIFLVAVYSSASTL